MTTSRLSRRAVIGTVLATTLIGAGLAAFADEAPAGNCPTWTDPKGDATTGQEPTGTLSDDQMDIVTASLATTDGKVVATIGDVALGDTASDFGDEFHINFTLGGKQMQVYTDRGASAGGPLTSPVGFGAGFVNLTDSTTGEATATYDTKKNTVTITGTVAELSKALGADATGKVATDIVAETQDYIPQVGGFIYDDAPTKLTFTVGADCGGGAAPAPTPSASASADPTPAPAPSGGPAPATGTDPLKDRPAAGCATFKDAKGDASYNNTPNDPDLDMTEVAMRTTADAFVTYIKVDKLAAKPTATDGHRFYSEFTFNKHVFSIAASSFSSYGGQLRDGASQTGQVGPTSVMSVDSQGTGGDPGFTDTKVTSTFDVKTSTVVLSVPLAAIEKYGKAPVAGATFSAVQTRAGYDSGVLIFVADTVKPVKAADDVYVVGDNRCFVPPAPPLSSVGAVKAQYGDAAAVAAKLVDAAGAPVAGKAVTFTVGSSKVTATTGADGIAKGALVIKEKAGNRTLVITSGDATASVPFTVSVEKTTLKAVGGKGTVTATLTDDDRKPVAGQVVTFASGSKKVSVKTDAKGVAKATGLPAGNVKVTYAGAAGMYTASSATTKSS